MTEQLGLFGPRTTGPCGYTWRSAGELHTCATPLEQHPPWHMTASRAAGVSVGAHPNDTTEVTER